MELFRKFIYFGRGRRPLFREELSKFKWLFSCFWGGLNNCPDGLWHIFIATMVIFSNWSQNAQPGPAPECPVECGGGGVIAIWAVPKCRVHERLLVFPYRTTDCQKVFIFRKTDYYFNGRCFSVTFLRCLTSLGIGKR